MSCVSETQPEMDENYKLTANTWHSPNAVSMLNQRLRRWPDTETALGDGHCHARHRSNAGYTDTSPGQL